MQRPSFQFYPGDWRANSNLRRCSWAARGVWIEVLCLMHDAKPYGVLRWPLEEFSKALGCQMKLLRELADKGVLQGTDRGRCEPYIYTPRSGGKVGPPVTLVSQQKGPIWYSTKMVRDEYVRKHRGESSRFGRSDSPNPTPKPPFSDGSSSSSSSSSSQEKKEKTPHYGQARPLGQLLAKKIEELGPRTASEAA